MDPASALPNRILLCASAAHSAQILMAASQARVPLHGLQLVTSWPLLLKSSDTLLWAVLPAHAPADALHVECTWRERLIADQLPCKVHMLYGNAIQQAAQLKPWLQQPPDHNAQEHAGLASLCWECVDPASEQQLFEHLLQRNETMPAAGKAKQA